jgi:hypothetical protein
LSDNGDFLRVLAPLGLQRPPGSAGGGFVVLRYAYGDVAADGYGSSLMPFLRLVTGAPRWLGADSFDIRWLGACYAVALGVVVWLVVRAVGTGVVQIAVAVGLVVVLTDSAFASYLASFYSEPGSLFGLLFTLGVLLLVRGRRVVPVGLLVLGTVAAVLLVTSKTQNAPLALVLAPALLLLRPRKWAVPAAVLLVAVAGLYVRAQPAVFADRNTYNVVFVSLVADSRDPAADLRALGIDSSLARFAGTSVYAHPEALKDPSVRRFLDHGARLKIARLYLRHPDRAFSLANRGARAAAEIRAPYLGNRAREQGYRPGTKACEFCLYSPISRWLEPASVVLLPSLYLLALAVSLRLRRRDPDERNSTQPRTAPDPARGLADALTLTALLGCVAFAAALAGEGDYELIKHLYLFDATTGVLAVLVVGGILTLWRDSAAAARLSSRSPFGRRHGQPHGPDTRENSGDLDLGHEVQHAHLGALAEDAE